MTDARGVVSVTIPPGALSEGVEVRIVAAATYPADPTLIPGTPVLLEPDGLTLAVPATIGMRYEEATLPAGVGGSDLQIATIVANQWSPIPPDSVDLTGHRIFAPLNGFTGYALVGRAPLIIAGEADVIPMFGSMFVHLLNTHGEEVEARWQVSPAGYACVNAGVSSCPANTIGTEIGVNLDGRREGEVTLRAVTASGVPYERVYQVGYRLLLAPNSFVMGYGTSVAVSVVGGTPAGSTLFTWRALGQQAFLMPISVASQATVFGGGLGADTVLVSTGGEVGTSFTGIAVLTVLPSFVGAYVPTDSVSASYPCRLLGPPSLGVTAGGRADYSYSYDCGAGAASYTMHADLSSLVASPSNPCGRLFATRLLQPTVGVTWVDGVDGGTISGCGDPTHGLWQISGGPPPLCSPSGGCANNPIPSAGGYFSKQ